MSDAGEQEAMPQEQQAPVEDPPQETPDEQVAQDVPAEQDTPTEETVVVSSPAEPAAADTPAEPSPPEAQHQPQTEPATKESTGTGTVSEGQKFETDPHAPSPPPPPRAPTGTATVKFVLMPSGQVATIACSLSQTLQQLKDHFAQDLKMPANLILLMFDGKPTDNDITLADLGVGPNGTVQLEMQSADPSTPLKPYRPKREYVMPDVITVRVEAVDGGFKDLVVEIERAPRKKPFLGGYRHKETAVEFHHASAQTVKKLPPPSPVTKFCRDTQTAMLKHKPLQTFNETSTQMTGVGVYVSNMSDKLLIPGKYTTADERFEMMLSRIVIIQKYFRRWYAKRTVIRLREDKEKRLAWEREEEIRKKREKEERIRREFERRMNPKNKEDFDLLYAALEKWRQEEEHNINQSLTGAERKAALCQLLEQETQLIASIGRHSNAASEDVTKQNVQSFLNKSAAPKRWKGVDGSFTEMDTPYTLRAKELRDIYASINMRYLTQDERLDVLLTLKHTVKEHDCKLTQEIIELIDREADLLMRGVKEAKLEGLRKRISTLFLQYIKTPTFNPEAARLLKVPQDPATLRKDIYYCQCCGSYLPSTEFQLSLNSRATGRCRRCTKLDNDGRTRVDHAQYRLMMKQLRRSEENKGEESCIAFLLQEEDMLYLVEKVWGGQSILSAWDDLYDLTFVRWNKYEEWSPWNCVLLTKDEAAAHEKLQNLEEGYGKVFVHKVNHRHALARNYFSRLPGMAQHMRKANKHGAPSITGKAVSQQPIVA